MTGHFLEDGKVSRTCGSEVARVDAERINSFGAELDRSLST
jgi:hypothetical protein